MTVKELNQIARGGIVETSEEEDTERTDLATTERQEERKANFKEEVKAAA